MSVYTDNSNWINDVYEYDVTDPVIGGPTGIANKPLHDLADRTHWLKDQIGRVRRLEGATGFTASGSIINNYIGNIINLDVLAPATFTLDNASAFEQGALFFFFATCADGAVANIVASAGQNINGSDGNVISLHDRESVVLAAFTNHFKIVHYSGNLFSVGEEIKSRIILPGTLPFIGQTVLRASFPRLTKFVLNKLTDGQEKVSEALWFSDNITYRGCFTEGDGATTIRLPDERAMADRMLDLGRGIDLSRTHNFAGGYEADDIKAHTHTVYAKASSASNGGAITDGGNDNQNTTSATSSTGGPETIVKNIGKLNLIKY